MYNDPNAPQQPYGQSPYTSPYEQQYGQQPAPPPTYPPTQYGAGTLPPVVPVYVPQQQQSSSKTVWIVLGVIGAILLLVGGGCIAAVVYGANKASQSVKNFTNEINATATADQQTFVADESSPSQQAEDYYLAISVQDYSNAYNYLAPHMTTTDGKALTQALFTQQAEALDQSEGQVSTYNATADPNDKTKVTVQVSREGGKSYTVHLTFVQGNDQWVISSFDNI